IDRRVQGCVHAGVCKRRRRVVVSREQSELLRVVAERNLLCAVTEIDDLLKAWFHHDFVCNTRARRGMPSSIRAVVGWLKFRRMLLDRFLFTLKAWPGMNATCSSSSALRNSSSTSTVDGNSTQTKKPQSGLVQLAASGKFSASARSIVSRLRPYCVRNISICAGSWPVSRYALTTRCESGAASMSVDSLMTDSGRISSSGTTSQPTRNAGARIFENEPT